MNGTNTGKNTDWHKYWLAKILNGKTHGMQRQHFCPSIHESCVKSLVEDCNLRGSITIGMLNRGSIEDQSQWEWLRYIYILCTGFKVEINMMFKVTNRKFTFDFVWAIILFQSYNKWKDKKTNKLIWFSVGYNSISLRDISRMVYVRQSAAAAAFSAWLHREGRRQNIFPHRMHSDQNTEY